MIKIRTLNKFSGCGMNMDLKAIEKGSGFVHLCVQSEQYSTDFSVRPRLSIRRFVVISHTYLAQGSTMITKVVPPGRGSPIALWLG